MSMRVAMNMYFLHKVVRPRAVGSLHSDASLSKLQKRNGSDIVSISNSLSMT